MIKPNLEQPTQEKPKNELELLLEQLEQKEGFGDLSNGQKRLVARNMQQLSLGRIQEQAEEQYKKETAESKFLGRIWKGVTQRFQIAEKQRQTAHEIKTEEFLGIEDEVVDKLIAGARETQADVDESGKPRILYAQLPENLDRQDQEKFKEFNKVAYEFGNIPHEWEHETATREQREEYRKIEKRYEYLRNIVLEIQSYRLGREESLKYGLEFEKKIKADQFLNTHPDVEEQLREVEDSPAWIRAIKKIVTDNGDIKGVSIGSSITTSFLDFGIKDFAAQRGEFTIEISREKMEFREELIELREELAKKVDDYMVRDIEEQTKAGKIKEGSLGQEKIAKIRQDIINHKDVGRLANEIGMDEEKINRLRELERQAQEHGSEELQKELKQKVDDYMVRDIEEQIKAGKIKKGSLGEKKIAELRGYIVSYEDVGRLANEIGMDEEKINRLRELERQAQELKELRALRAELIEKISEEAEKAHFSEHIPWEETYAQFTARMLADKNEQTRLIGAEKAKKLNDLESKENLGKNLIDAKLQIGKVDLLLTKLRNKDFGTEKDFQEHKRKIDDQRYDPIQVNNTNIIEEAALQERLEKEFEQYKARETGQAAKVQENLIPKKEKYDNLKPESEIEIITTLEDYRSAREKRILASLENRLKFIEEKKSKGLVYYGDGMGERIGSQADLLAIENEACLYAAMSKVDDKGEKHSKALDQKLNNFLNFKKEKVGKAKKSHILNKFKKAVMSIGSYF